jgi:hypothetical protein
MKKSIIAVLTAFLWTGGAFSQTITLDNALDACFLSFEQNLPRGTRVAVARIETNEARLSAYMTEKLRLRFVRDSPFIITEPKIAQAAITGTLIESDGTYHFKATATHIVSGRVIARFEIGNITLTGHEKK